VTTGQIPHSGDYMRIFARTPMTGAAMRIAIALAGHISYDGTYRGAPKGFAAFTMIELGKMTELSSRAIRKAMDELAELFGLTIHRRHHDRHLFQFADICNAEIDVEEDDVDAPKPSIAKRVIEAVKPRKKRVTGTPVPPSLYTRTKSNNHTPSVIKISESAGSVHQTPFAEVIEEAKRGTDAENMDVQFLWQGFHLVNTRNEHAVAPLSWLIAFVRKAKPCYSQMKPKTPAKPEQAPVCTDPVMLMAKPAKVANRQFHESDLTRAIGREAYDQRVVAIQTKYGANRFAAQLAVHGQAVKEGTISP